MYKYMSYTVHIQIPEIFSPLFKSSYNEAIFFSPIRGEGS